MWWHHRVGMYVRVIHDLLLWVESVCGGLEGGHLRWEGLLAAMMVGEHLCWVGRRLRELMLLDLLLLLLKLSLCGVGPSGFNFAAFDGEFFVYDDDGCSD